METKTPLSPGRSRSVGLRRGRAATGATLCTFLESQAGEKGGILPVAFLGVFGGVWLVKFEMFHVRLFFVVVYSGITMCFLSIL